jgi:hypothetical protein
VCRVHVYEFIMRVYICTQDPGQSGGRGPSGSV